MCGLVGIAGALAYSDEATLRRLLLFDYFRGMDSTGIAAIRNSGASVIAKVDSNPIVLFEMKSFDKALEFYTSKAFIGHNRAATIGAVSIANAHPFRFEHITGAHNGTLDKDSHKFLEEILGNEYGSDSQALFAAIAEFGVENVIPDLWGAWALTWYDARKNTMNFLKNDQRPLWLAYTQDHDQLFWASEWPIMEAALNTGGASYKMYADDDGCQFFPVKNNMHYAFDLDDLYKGIRFDLDDKIVAEIKGKEPKPVSKGAASPFKPLKTTTTAHGTTGFSSVPANKPIESLTIVAQNPYRDFLTEAEFKHIAKYGCTWCSQDVQMDDPGLKIWKNEEIILCGSCSNQGSKPSTLYVDEIPALG